MTEHDETREPDTHPERSAEPGDQQAGAEQSAPAAGEPDTTLTDEDLRRLMEEVGNLTPDGDEAPSSESESQEQESADASTNDAASEHLEDLRRIQAEYANYRRRTEREKEQLQSVATGAAFAKLLPVLDDLDRAEAHGDLAEDGPITVIVGKLRTLLEKQGLTRYGAKGDVFDPQRYEAIAQLPGAEGDEPVVADVVEAGYEFGDRVLRVAKVAVFLPAE